MPSLDLTCFKNETNPFGSSLQTTEESFIQCFSNPLIKSVKTGNPLIGPYTLNGTLHRKNENVETITMLAFDIDNANGKSFDDIFSLVANYKGVMHTSYRHSETKTKCRIFLFLTSPIPVIKFEIVRANFLSNHEELARIIDSSCKHLSSMYFVFSCPKENQSIARSAVMKGKPIDWKTYDREFSNTFAPEFNPPSRNVADDDSLVFEGERYTKRCKMIGSLINQGLTQEEVLKATLEWNASKCLPPDDEQLVIKNVKGIWKKDQKEKVLFQRAFEIPTLEKSPRERYKLFTWDDLKKVPELEWRVKKVFPKKGLASIYGPSQSGKTYLAIDMALHIALGIDWFGNRVHSTEIVYCILEGEYGLKNRVKAWEIANSKSCPANFKTFLDPFRINNAQDIEDFARILPKECVVFIDTLNRSAPDADENSSKDMGLIIDGMKKIQSQCEGLVICVHHTGKDVSKGLRGHSSLLAALDSAIQVERTQTLRSWTLAKSKEGEDGKTVGFQLNTHQLGKDRDGDSITACSISKNISHITQKREPSGKQQKAGLTLIRKLLSQSNIKNKCTSGANTQCIKVAEAIERFSETLTAVPSNKRNSRSGSVVQSLINGGYVKTGTSNSEGWLWVET